MRTFAELGEQEILALAISLEEEDARVYLEYAHGLEERYPASAKIFTEMSAEEKHALSHRGRAFRALAELLTNRAGPPATPR